MMRFAVKTNVLKIVVMRRITVKTEKNNKYGKKNKWKFCFDRNHESFEYYEDKKANPEEYYCNSFIDFLDFLAL